MATSKKAKAKSKAKRRPAPAAKPAARKKTVKVGKKPAKKAPVRRAAPVKTKPAARPAAASPSKQPAPAKPSAASAPKQPAPAKPAASGPVQPQATWPGPASAQAPAAPAGERIGVVTHYYGHLSVAVVRLESGRLRVGDMVLIRGHTSDFSQRVESLQVEHRPVAEVGPNDDFALKVIAHAREHDVVYKLGP